MAAPISRRTILAAGAATAAGLVLPGVAAEAGGRPTTSVGFTLNAEVLDGGEQVTSITVNTAQLGPIDPASLKTGTFGVHAKATSPIPIAAGDLIFSEYDLDRPVTAARLDQRGNIVLDLAYGEGQVGGGTLGYIVSKGRNVQLDLVYTITQNAPVTLRNHRSITFATFVQGRLSDPQVDAFSYRISGSGMKYRLYAPTQGGGRSRSTGRGKRPLVVWLHGGGEGASLPDNYYDNETTLRANRGALGFATPQAQRIFSGAYVVAPQSTSFWIEDGPRFAPLIREIVGDLVRRYPIDSGRIYLAGCSNGGYMTMKMTTIYPDLFASAVPICGVVAPLQPGGPTLITDAELSHIDTPTWLVASRDDPVVPPEPNTIHAHDLIPGSLMTLYDHVIWNGDQFNGHWSWIYVARNDPKIGGTHIWQWMAQQRR
jgi:predicted peptidase